MKTRLFALEPAYFSRDVDVDGWYAAPVPEGATRCIWDGGLTRNVSLNTWDWGSGSPTGLFDERGTIVRASDGLLDSMPKMSLDGYLYEEDGVEYYGIISLVCSQQLLRIGSVFAQGRIFEFEPDAIYHLLMTSEGGPAYKSTAEQTNFLEDIQYRPDVETSRAHLLPFRQISNHVEGRYIVRSPYSTWTPEFTHYWLTSDYHHSTIATVQIIDHNKIVTSSGVFFCSPHQPLPKVGDDIRVYLNPLGIIIGFEEAKAPVVHRTEAVRGSTG